jgi:hypothetical protein
LTTAAPGGTLTPTLASSPSPTARVTPTLRPTRTPRPTLTPTITATPEPRFALVRQESLCEESGVLRVTVLDGEGLPQPNVELLIRWENGEDRFFTGLKPERGVGYADYDLVPGTSYQVGIVGMESDVATGIETVSCAEGARTSWELLFRLQGSAP